MNHRFPEDARFEQLDKSLTVTFRIPESYPYFEGHFPGNPLVPAVVQIGWAISGISQLLGKEPVNYQISRFKFLSPILPGNEVEVTVMETGSGYQCQVSVDGQFCSKGLVVLESDV